MKVRSILMACCAAALLAGFIARWLGLPHWGWLIAISAAALIFLFLLPAMGERSRQPLDAPERRGPWTSG